MTGVGALDPSRRETRIQIAVLATILIASLVLKLPHLGHASIKPLDEAFHAIVARNFLKHPLTPTLDDSPALPAQNGDWLNAHIWLHKPPLAMWQIAISFALFGVNTLALRLPSLILSAAAAGFTYLIGRELLDGWAGLIASALQAFNPPIVMLVHGYVFSDHVDISLLFWTEAGIYFLVRSLRTARKRDLILAGVAQGLAILSKSYPALIVTGVALVAWLFSRLQSRISSSPETRSPKPETRFQFGARQFLLLLGVTIATILPWTLWAYLHWPEQFVAENLNALRHVNTDIENWAAPWDRLIFDFSIRIYHVYYPATLAALIWAIGLAWKRRDARLWIVIAWGLGVLIPHTLVVSKTMTATLVGWPAMWLLLGWLIRRAFCGGNLALGIWLIAMLMAVLLIHSGDIPQIGWGYPRTPGFGVIMRQNIWVAWHVIAALGGGALLAFQLRRSPDGLIVTLRAVAAVVMLFLAVKWWGGGRPSGYAWLDWRAVEIAQEQPNFAAIGTFAQKLPASAVFIVAERSRVENKQIQFAADRTCYALGENDWRAFGQAIIQAGGLPYLVTDQFVPGLPAVMQDDQDNETIYACTPAARQAAERAGQISGGF